MQKGTQAYVQTKFSTVGQGEVLILLYDGAIKFLTLAKEKIREKDPAGKGILISKALDIINELDSSINMEAGGSLAKNLHQLYFVCSTRLLKANLRMDIAAIDSVLEILLGLRDAYAQILNKPEARAASAQIASRLPANAATPNRAAPLPPPTLTPSGISRPQAQNVYAQNTGTAAVVPPSPAAPAPQLSQPVAPPAAAQQDAPVMPLNPAAPVAPVNLGGRRLAAAASYGKIAQNM